MDIFTISEKYFIAPTNFTPISQELPTQLRFLFHLEGDFQVIVFFLNFSELFSQFLQQRFKVDCFLIRLGQLGVQLAIFTFNLLELLELTLIRNLICSKLISPPPAEGWSPSVRPSWSPGSWPTSGERSPAPAPLRHSPPTVCQTSSIPRGPTGLPDIRPSE